MHEFDLDLDRLAEPGAAEEPAAERCLRLAAALDRYRGPVLADVIRLGRSDPLVLGAEKLVLRRCLELADVAEATGRPELGIGPLETYTSCDPYEEMVQARLVELLAAAGPAGGGAGPVRAGPGAAAGRAGRAAVPAAAPRRRPRGGVATAPAGPARRRRAAPRRRPTSSGGGRRRADAPARPAGPASRLVPAGARLRGRWPRRPGS